MVLEGSKFEKRGTGGCCGEEKLRFACGEKKGRLEKNSPLTIDDKKEKNRVDREGGRGAVKREKWRVSCKGELNSASKGKNDRAELLGKN